MKSALLAFTSLALLTQSIGACQAGQFQFCMWLYSVGFVLAVAALGLAFRRAQ